jgi:hypothetical protein
MSAENPSEQLPQGSEQKEWQGQKWEYQTHFLIAHIDSEGAKELLKERWPEWEPGEFVPETMIPELNALGENGWELILMQPVVTDKSGSVLHVGRYPKTSNFYFCVFKRQITQEGSQEKR